MLPGMTPPANSEPLDPMFLLVWPHPQGITQIKGTRFFPTSVLPVVLFRDLQSGKATSNDLEKIESCFAENKSILIEMKIYM